MKYLEVIENIRFYINQYVCNIVKLLNDSNQYFLQMRNIREDFDLTTENSFNFFTSISPVYYWENFHSDILKIILDKNTKQIGNNEYLNKFLDLLDDHSLFSTKDEVVIYREKGKIDLLIHNSKYAIIIENKINNAPDQPNQLARYIEYVNGKGLEVLCIVYLTLVFGKKPNLNYDLRYLKYHTEIKSKIKYITAVDKNRNDLAHQFIESCIKNTENTTAIVYLQQYKQLLLSLGANELMKELSKRIVEVIYSNKENIKNVNDLFEIWSNKDSIVREIVFDKIKAERSGYFDHDYGETVSKIINERFSFAYHKSGSYGFIISSGKNEFAKKDKIQLIGILENEVFNTFSSEVKNDDTSWIYRDIMWNNLNYDLNELLAFVNDKINLLESEYSRKFT